MQPALTMRNDLVTVFGGSGFLGRHVVRALAKRGWRVRVACRRPDLANFLVPSGLVGQIHAVQANLRYADSVARALDGASAVVNCVGILFEGGKQNFTAVQELGAKNIAQAAAKKGITNFVHISAIGADEKSDSAYAVSKARGEKHVLENIHLARILRPSLLFGTEDNFFNKFASLARFLPFLPLIGGGKTRFQPVSVDDVAEAVALCLDGEVKPGAIYELGGPDIKTFKELLQLTLEETARKRLLVPVPFMLAKLKAAFLQLLPNPLLTIDQVRLLQRDNIVSEKALIEERTFDAFGIAPKSLASILPTYLWRYRKGGQFADIASDSVR
ncbi:MAG: complex I NDUFA9 subunit family protein [Pseudomonadota bacterium]